MTLREYLSIPIKEREVYFTVRKHDGSIALCSRDDMSFAVLDNENMKQWYDWEVLKTSSDKSALL